MNGTFIFKRKITWVSGERRYFLLFFQLYCPRLPLTSVIHCFTVFHCILFFPSCRSFPPSLTHILYSCPVLPNSILLSILLFSSRLLLCVCVCEMGEFPAVLLLTLARYLSTCFLSPVCRRGDGNTLFPLFDTILLLQCSLTSVLRCLRKPGWLYNSCPARGKEEKKEKASLAVFDWTCDTVKLHYSAGVMETI